MYEQRQTAGFGMIRSRSHGAHGPNCTDDSPLLRAGAGPDAWTPSAWVPDVQNGGLQYASSLPNRHRPVSPEPPRPRSHLLLRLSTVNSDCSIE
ncbi:hypothetical protein P7K49_012865 [Saguinus oedipus]|uniref:Uncharacterized protein n=1 Tax=Saguinus oedipus TaxID=9490 RepID=A0ABQ9VF61_SAGOE|nr:hypothetical protein P7K49_012865 [Saguinus oedipus]